MNLTGPDAQYLKSSATSVITYWFIDCVYYGPTNDFRFDYNYSAPDKEHTIEALVVAGYEPITTPAPSTTTTPAPNITTTTSKPTTLTTPTTTTSTIKPNNVTITTAANKSVENTHSQSVNLISYHRQKRAASHNNSTIMVKVNGTLVPYNGSFPFVCLNNTVAPDPSKTYGYFSKIVQVKGGYFLFYINKSSPFLKVLLKI